MIKLDFRYYKNALEKVNDNRIKNIRLFMDYVIETNDIFGIKFNLYKVDDLFLVSYEDVNPVNNTTQFVKGCYIGYFGGDFIE